MTRAGHILTYAQSLKGGGVERAMLRLTAQWLDLGRRVTLVVGIADGPLVHEVPPGADVVVLGSADYRALMALPEQVRRTRPDVIFCPGSHYTAIAAWTRLRLGRACPPLVGKVSNAVKRPDFGTATAAGQAIWLALHPRFLDRIVAMTPASAQEAAKAMRLPPDRPSVIPNPPARPIPGAPAVSLPPRYILGVGRLAPQKRWDRLVAATARLNQRVPLVILGEGKEREALQAQAQALGVSLVLPGHAADPLGAMGGAALLALTSDFEGVPGVLREALSVGTPVVATNASPAVAEIIAHPTFGSIVGREDADGLVAALDYWLGQVARPAPVPSPGSDAGARYLALFDSLMPA